MPISAKIFNLEIAYRAHRALAANRKRRKSAISGPTDLFLCIVDHHEPQVGQPSRGIALSRVEDWLHRWPKIADRHCDSDGKSPRHSFFYPWDEYEDREFARLSELCAAGYGEMELHLHHRDDTSETLRQKLDAAIAAYTAHGALSRWDNGRPAFGFIHGNWALDNSRHDAGRNYCGVNDELRVLAQAGCYADFTFPAWQHTAQPRQTNSLFFATDDPLQPKSYDTGAAMQAGGPQSGDLPIIQGPLVPYLRSAGQGFRPAMDDGDLAWYRRYCPARLDRWVQAGIHVLGRPDRIFIKLHTHGAADKNRAVLLGEDFDALFSDAESRYNDGTYWRLHYVTAREMFNVALATQQSENLDIAASRDYLLKAPGGRLVKAPF